MSVVLKKNKLAVREGIGPFESIDILTDSNVSEQIAEIESGCAAVISNCQQALSTQETRAAGIVSDTQGSIDDIAEAVASMAQLGTDTALTTSGMAADAKAVGDAVGEVEKRYTAVTLNYTSGYRFNNRNPGQEMGYSESSAWGYTYIAVTAGEKYRVNTYAPVADTYLVYYLDSSQLIIDRDYHASDLVAGVQQFDLTIPTGAVYLYVQCNSNSDNISNYLKIAEIETVSVSESIADLKDEFYDAEYIEFDINRAFTEENRYVKTDGTCANSSGSDAYRRIDVSDCDTVKIKNMYLSGARAFVGTDANGDVTVILTNKGSALVSGTYDVSAFESISFTGQSGTLPEVWKYAPKASDTGIIHGETYDSGFNLFDYEIKGTSAVSRTTQYGSSFFENRICYGANSRSLALRGYTVASGRDPQMYINISPIDATGIQSFIVPVYTEDAANISLFYLGILKDEETAPSWFRQITSLQNGWNYLRFDSIDYPAGLATWNHVNGYRILMRAVADSTVYIGDIITVKPNKAKLVFICDHGYKNFADVALPEFESRGFPVTFAMKLSMLGQSVEYASRILTEAEVIELAQNPMVDINIHSALSTPSKDQTAEQTKEDAWKGLYFLKTHGCYVFAYRAAWWNNNAPYADDLDNILVMSATYTRADTSITAFPFANPHNVPRYVVHTLDTTRIDTIFDQMEKTHGTILMYTHDISDATVPEGTTRINMTTAELTYLLSKIDAAVSDGWLEGETVRGLYTKYAKV